MYFIQTNTEKIPILAFEYVTVVNGSYQNTDAANADGAKVLIDSEEDGQIIVPFVFTGHQLLGDEEVGDFVIEPDPEPSPDDEIDSDALQQMLEEIL